MKTICIDGPIFMTGIVLKREFKMIIDVYSFGNYSGFIELSTYRLRHKFNTQDTKYYTIEKRV